jgi:hypothetical protein
MVKEVIEWLQLEIEDMKKEEEGPLNIQRFNTFHYILHSIESNQYKKRIELLK